MEQSAKDIIATIQSGKLSIASLEELSSKVKEAIKADPSKGKEFGQLMGFLSQAMKQKDQKAEINWVAVGQGALAIGHKPGGKISFEGMRNAGVTAVLTLLQEKEGAISIGDQVKKVGMEWIWFPFSASQDKLLDDTSMVSGLFAKLKVKLDAGAKIYLHCSAGIHRTGMITYGLLRFLGMKTEEARINLRELREVTAEQVGEERLVWGDQFGR